MPELSSFINITTQVSARGVVAPNLGRTMFLYEAADVPAFDVADMVFRQRDLGINVYADSASVNAKYNVDDAAQLAAASYFAQKPAPQNYLTASRFAAGARSFVYTHEAIANLADAKVNGTLVFGARPPVNVAFLLGDSGAQTAMKIQLAIRTIDDLDTATVGYTAAGNRFLLSTTVAQSGAITGPVTGTLGAALKWDNTASAYPGVAAETLTEALDRIRLRNASWYWLIADSSLVDNEVKLIEVARWAAVNSVLFVPDIANDDGALVTNEDASRTAALSELEFDRVAPVWSRTYDYKGASLAARFSSVNFDFVDSLITAKFKKLPGTAPDDLDDIEAAELNRKRTNYYAYFNGEAIVAEGVTSNDSTYIDVRYWLDWLVNKLRTELFNYQLRVNRVPQTDFGVASILSIVDGVLNLGVDNGGIGPGTLSEAVASNVRSVIGNTEFDGFLPSGYLSYVKPLSQQLQSDRAARKFPPIYIWCKGSGAVHSADIQISFEN